MTTAFGRSGTGGHCRFGQLQEAVKPHLIAVQVAVKDLIAALLTLAPKPPAGDKAN